MLYSALLMTMMAAPTASITNVHLNVASQELTVDVGTPTEGWVVSATPVVYVVKPDWWQIEIAVTAPGGARPIRQNPETQSIKIPLSKWVDLVGDEERKPKPRSIVGKEGVILKLGEQTIKVGFDSKK